MRPLHERMTREKFKPFLASLPFIKTVTQLLSLYIRYIFRAKLSKEVHGLIVKYNLNQ